MPLSIAKVLIRHSQCDRQPQDPRAAAENTLATRCDCYPPEGQPAYKEGLQSVKAAFQDWEIQPPEFLCVDWFKGSSNTAKQVFGNCLFAHGSFQRPAFAALVQIGTIPRHPAKLAVLPNGAHLAHPIRGRSTPLRAEVGRGRVHFVLQEGLPPSAVIVWKGAPDHGHLQNVGGKGVDWMVPQARFPE